MFLWVCVFLGLIGSISAKITSKEAKKPKLSLEDLKLKDAALRKIDFSNITMPTKLGDRQFSKWQDAGLLDKIMYIDVK